MNKWWRAIREWWYESELCELENNLYDAVEATRYGYENVDPKDTLLLAKIDKAYADIARIEDRIRKLIGDDGWNELEHRYIDSSKHQVKSVQCVMAMGPDFNDVNDILPQAEAYGEANHKAVVELLTENAINEIRAGDV